MSKLDPGILENSICHAFAPSPLAKQLFFYPTWLGHYFCTNRYFIRRNRYQYMLLMYVVKGVFNCRYRNHDCQATGGDILLLDCTEPHYYHAQDGLEFMYLHYDGSNSADLTHFIQEQYGWHIQKDNNYKVGNILQDMLIFYQHNGVDNVMERSAQIYRLLEELLRPSAEEKAEDLEIAKVIQYIRANLNQPITLQELASLINLSPFYFSHYFKKRTEFSPMDYVINMKIDYAKGLLIRTNKPIAEIAAAVGYAGTTAFSNIFSKRVGLSPRNYRNYHTNRSSG